MPTSIEKSGSSGAGISAKQWPPGAKEELLFDHTGLSIPESPIGHYPSPVVLAPAGTEDCVKIGHLSMEERPVLVHLCPLCCL